jgi:hypothetical protein
LEGRCKTSPASSSQAGGSRWICPSGKQRDPLPLPPPAGPLPLPPPAGPLPLPPPAGPLSCLGRAT